MNSTIRFRVSFREVNLSTLISANFDFECSSCDRLWFWGYPSLLALGLVGNALCLVAFAAYKLRRATRFLCTLLAAFDSLALVTAFVTRWPDAAFDFSLVNMHQSVCYITNISNYWLPEVAAWILVGISVERVLSGRNLLFYLQKYYQ